MEYWKHERLVLCRLKIHNELLMTVCNISLRKGPGTLPCDFKPVILKAIFAISFPSLKSCSSLKTGFRFCWRTTCDQPEPMSYWKKGGFMILLEINLWISPPPPSIYLHSSTELLQPRDHTLAHTSHNNGLTGLSNDFEG